MRMISYKNQKSTIVLESSWKLVDNLEESFQKLQEHGTALVRKARVIRCVAVTVYEPTKSAGDEDDANHEADKENNR